MSNAMALDNVIAAYEVYDETDEARVNGAREELARLRRSDRIVAALRLILYQHPGGQLEDALESAEKTATAIEDALAEAERKVTNG